LSIASSTPRAAPIRARLSALRGQGGGAADAAAEAVAIAGELQRLAWTGGRRREDRAQARLAALMDDPAGRCFTTALTDQLARARDPARVADQVAHLIDHYGLPAYLGRFERAQLQAFRVLGPLLPRLLVPLLLQRVRRESADVVGPGESGPLKRYLEARLRDGVRINLNLLGEAILGEREAEARLGRCLDAIARPEVECVSVKVSAIASQLELLAWQDVLGLLSERLRRLYRQAMRSVHQRPDGRRVPKLVYLDMEEHRDLELTVELFRLVLDEAEFRSCCAGIVLQTYLPDAQPVQRQLVAWARKRVASGGVPIRIRLVKGANLAMERCEAAEHGWPQAPCTSKAEVDANFKRMLLWGARPENLAVAQLGVASHNVFDIALGLVVRALAGSEEGVGFEMLAGTSEPLRRAVQAVAGDVLVYSPVVRREEFQSAIAYLMRRLEENTSPENFLAVSFGLRPGSPAWRQQERRFLEAWARRDDAPIGARRTQDRRARFAPPVPDAPFENEPDTDFSLARNREWVRAVTADWRTCPPREVPCQVDGEIVFDAAGGWSDGDDPSLPERRLYRVALADEALAERAVSAGVGAAQAWGARSIAARSGILAQVAQQLREARGELIGVMMADGGKAIPEADAEVSEAVDFAESYRRSLEEFGATADLALSPREVVVVAPPWNFPVAIPAGGVLAALMAGNAVILKPAPETVLAAWVLARTFWDAGVPRDVLQFLPCRDEPVGSLLISHPDVACVVLTGSTETARRFHRMRGGRLLVAETGGKNGFVVTALADRDLAIRHAVRSAFGHAGQKCSAASLLICEAEVYDDSAFRERLADAARSLHVGSAWDPRSVVTPLIRPPRGALEKALTTLEPGEEWLLEPRADPANPRLWSPGIKLGVREGSTLHRTELFGPVLAMLRADDLEHAIRIANATPYGLTGALHSLDEREWQRWIEAVEVGNAYVNRGTVGAIVRRQPFGGCKASSFGPGAKAGGPNYVLQLMHVGQRGWPEAGAAPDASVRELLPRLERPLDSEAQRFALRRAAESYAKAWRNHFSVEHDPSRVLGQDNLFRYRPVPGIVLRLGRGARPLAVSCALLAAHTCGIVLPISLDENDGEGRATIGALGTWPHVLEGEDALAARLETDRVGRIRCLGRLGHGLRAAAQAAAVHCEEAPVLANGRVELLRYLREQSVSIDYHRHGNLGERAAEVRAPVL
jgi:RHH-type proline utilization regulon transcriptional repressor/proline dehydrogenase/delta 1-pyrroline-5-carboxylate dehydrogenase